MSSHDSSSRSSSSVSGKHGSVSTSVSSTSGSGSGGGGALRTCVDLLLHLAVQGKVGGEKHIEAVPLWTSRRTCHQQCAMQPAAEVPAAVVPAAVVPAAAQKGRRLSRKQDPRKQDFCRVIGPPQKVVTSPLRKARKQDFPRAA